MLSKLLRELFNNDERANLLDYICNKVPNILLKIPSPSFIDDNFVINSNRSSKVIRSMDTLFKSGYLANSGYLCLLAVDQGVEHTAGASFSINPTYFNPDNIVQLALEGGCNGIVTTLGSMAAVSRKYAHKIPFIVKINHNQLLTYPTKYDQIMYGSVKEAWNMGALGVGATIYFGSDNCNRQILEVSNAFEEAHSLGMFTVLWCYLRNDAFKVGEYDYHQSADLTGQANYIGCTIQADIIKQKLPYINQGFKNLKFGKMNDAMYSGLSNDNLIDLCRYQVLNNYAGVIPLLNSGGESFGDNDLKELIKTAIINKRSGGGGMVIGRKAFQRSMDEGVYFLNMVQSVYLDNNIKIA